MLPHTVVSRFVTFVARQDISPGVGWVMWMDGCKGIRLMAKFICTLIQPSVYFFCGFKFYTRC